MTHPVPIAQTRLHLDDTPMSIAHNEIQAAKARRLSAGFGVWAVWRRNALVWRKMAVSSILGHIVDPLIALLAFGYGIGGMLPSVNGQPYLNYLACGALCMSGLNAATFEALYSAFSRMHAQNTWDSILNTPVALQDIVLGEWLWAASKSVMSTTAMMGVVALLGVGSWSFWLPALLIIWLGALMFAAIGLCVNARATGYDFFTFYFTLAVTPMTFLSGAFFPREQLPHWLALLAQWLPLSLVVDAVRAVFIGHWQDIWMPLAIVVLYGAVALFFAVRWTEHRFRLR